MTKPTSASAVPVGPGHYVYEWPRPSVTADVALFRLATDCRPPRIEVLLIRRGRPPFANTWALPGGFVDRDEDLPHAATRELEEETGVRGVRIEQVGVIGTPGRDPRGHTVTALYTAAIAERAAIATAGDDAAEADWFSADALPRLAFDHGELVRWSLLHWRDRLGRSPLLFDLLPRRFDVVALRTAWAAVAGDTKGFVPTFRKLVKSGVLVAEAIGAQSGADARLRLDRRALRRLDPLAPRAGR